MLTCAHCQAEFVPRRTNKKNPQKYCSTVCSREVHKSTKCSHLCLSCNTATLNPRFCSSSCAATYNNTGRVQTDQTRIAIAKTLSMNAKRDGRTKLSDLKGTMIGNTGLHTKFEISGLYTRMYLCKCKISGIGWVSRSVKTIYPELSRTKKEYEYSCRFAFGISSYPLWFTDASTIISQYGWYSTPGSNKKGISNVDGISRDHMVSVSYGFKNNISPALLRHPANCQLLQHRKNQSKSTNCSMTVDALILRINEFNLMYPASPFGVEPKPSILEIDVPPPTLRTCRIH